MGLIDRRGASLDDYRAIDLLLPKIVDFDEDAGRFRYDERYASKREDRTYAPPASRPT